MLREFFGTLHTIDTTLRIAAVAGVIILPPLLILAATFRLWKRLGTK